MSDVTPRNPLVRVTVVASLALVVSLVTSAWVVSRAYLQRGEQPFRQNRTMDVTGSARSRIRSDLSLWKIRISGEGKTIEEAYQKLDAAEKGVRAFLAEKGFPDAAVQAGAIDTETHYKPDTKGRSTREVLSVELTRAFRIESADVEKTASAAGEVTELLKTGVHIESRSPEFYYTKLADLKIRMMGEATANARERAATIAEKSGCRLGAVREANAGVLQITAPWSTETSSGGVHDTSTIDKDVTSVVHVTFQIEK